MFAISLLRNLDSLHRWTDVIYVCCYGDKTNDDCLMEGWLQKAASVCIRRPRWNFLFWGSWREITEINKWEIRAYTKRRVKPVHTKCENVQQLLCPKTSMIITVCSFLLYEWTEYSMCIHIDTILYPSLDINLNEWVASSNCDQNLQNLIN